MPYVLWFPGSGNGTVCEESVSSRLADVWDKYLAIRDRYFHPDWDEDYPVGGTRAAKIAYVRRETGARVVPARVVFQAPRLTPAIEAAYRRHERRCIDWARRRLDSSR